MATKTEATCGSIRATVTSGGNVELATVHRGGLLGPMGNVEIQRADLDDAITALQRVRDEGGRVAADRDGRQAQIFAWAKQAFTTEQATSLTQRGLRLLEEAIKAFQAVEGHEHQAHALVDYVFARPPGVLSQELGGVGVTVLALAAAAGLSADEEEAREVGRVLSKPVEEFTRRNAAKNEAGFLATTDPAVPHDQAVLADLKALREAIGRLEAHKHSGWTAYDELVKTLTSEMADLGVPGTSVRNYGLVPAIKAALNHIRTAPHALIAERDAARTDCEQLRKMVFADDRVLFDGRPARTRSCSACHVGAVPDPYSLAPLDAAVKDAPVTAVMAIAVGSVDIFETTREAREIADRAGRAVAFDCQGVTVVLSPGDNPEAVARAWWWTRHGETPEQSAARR